MKLYGTLQDYNFSELIEKLKFFRWNIFKPVLRYWRPNGYRQIMNRFLHNHLFTELSNWTNISRCAPVIQRL